MQFSFRMNRRVIGLSLACILLSACAPSQRAIQTAIVQTQSAQTPTPDPTAPAADTPVPATLMAPPADTPTPSPIPRVGTIDSPIPFNAKGTLTDPLSGGTFDLQVQQVLRGQKAAYLVQQASTLNLNPPQAMEYVLIGVRLTLDAGDLNISDYDFIVDSRGALSDSFSSPVCCMTNVGYQVLHADLSTLGASAEGWIIRMAYLDDPRPLLAYRAGNDISKAVFFALSPAVQSP
ncbi:MAG TPA: hypothetical protein VLZ89_13590 [Anaerolineales bacterium]|nr:hypothetical protein [Anaerolineales bacterium]